MGRAQTALPLVELPLAVPDGGGQSAADEHAAARPQRQLSPSTASLLSQVRRMLYPTAFRCLASPNALPTMKSSVSICHICLLSS